MQNRNWGFAALLAVVGVSIVFGMILGGRLNAPPVVYAATEPSTALPPPSQGSPGTSTFADIVDRCLPAVVTVTSVARGGEEGESSPEGGWKHPFLDDPFFRRFFGQGTPEDRRAPQPRIGAGSGFIISPDGYLLTNNHVVEGFDKIEVALDDSRTFDARVVGTDPSIDLALLKIESADQTFPTLPLGDSDNLRVGEWVIAIGNPYEFDQTVTIGVVSGKERHVPLPGTDSGVVSFIQTDAAINLGNSGGPLIDAGGNVVGINTAIRRQNFAEGIGFALPINQARAVVDQLRESGQVRRGYIGIRMNDSPIDETTREYYGLGDASGVIVTLVEPDTPAEKAGLKKGDIIREIDGKRVRDNLDMISKVSSRRPGDVVRLLVHRKGKTTEIPVTLGDRKERLEEGAEGEEAPVPPDRPEPPEASSGLGLEVESLSDTARERLGLTAERRGVLVTSVDFESEAQRKGLVPDVLITAVNDRAIENVADWERAVDRLTPGSPVKLDALAPGEDRTLYFFLRTPQAKD